MKRRHVTGEKREKHGATDWYRAIEAAHIARIERDWPATEQVAQQEQATASVPPGGATPGGAVHV